MLRTDLAKKMLFLADVTFKWTSACIFQGQVGKSVLFSSVLISFLILFRQSDRKLERIAAVFQKKPATSHQLQCRTFDQE